MVWGGWFLGFGVLGLYNSVSMGLGVALGVCMLLLSCAGGVAAGFSWWGLLSGISWVGLLCVVGASGFVICGCFCFV